THTMWTGLTLAMAYAHVREAFRPTLGIQLDDWLPKLNPFPILGPDNVSSQKHTIIEVARLHEDRRVKLQLVADERVHTVFSFVYLAAELAFGDLHRRRQSRPDEARHTRTFSGQG